MTVKMNHLIILIIFIFWMTTLRIKMTTSPDGQTHHPDMIDNGDLLIVLMVK